jgi:hypothetical protein
MNEKPRTAMRFDQEHGARGFAIDGLIATP